MTSDEIEKKVRELEALGEKSLDIARQRAGAERQWRAWQRERSRAERELEETFRATWNQQESRKASGK